MYTKYIELCSMLCGSLDGRGTWGRMYTCICVAESPCGSPRSSHPSLSPAPSVLCVLQRPVSPLCTCSVAKSCHHDSMDWTLGFSKQKNCSRLPFPSSGDLPHPGMKPASLVSALAEVSLPLCHLGSPKIRTLHGPGIRTQTSHVAGKNATTEPMLPLNQRLTSLLSPHAILC